MKKLTLFTILLIIPFSALSDNRIDRDSNNCHIAIDPNDDDAETDVPCTLFSAQVNRYIDANGVRKASGSYHGKLKVPLSDTRVRPPLLIPNSSSDITLVGNANTRVMVNATTAANTQCDLVRSNYQENTGNDDQNQTEYTTNDWDLRVSWLGYEKKNGKIIKSFDFDDDKFDFNDDGVVDLSDFSRYRNKLATDQIGVWDIAMNCRNGAAQ